MNERIKKIMEWENGKKSGPFTIEIFPTFKCNQSCTFCPRIYIENDETPEVIDDQILIKIIEDAAKLKVQQIDLIGGGEPLTRKITPDLIRLIKKHNIRGYLNTNGSLFSEELIKDMVEKEWDYIKFSLHGPDKSTHDSITNLQGSFKKVISTLKRFKYWKKKLKKEKPIIEVGPVLCKKNYKKLLNFIKLAKKYNVKYLQVQPLIKYPDVKEKLNLGKEEIKYLESKKDKIINLAEKYGIHTNLKEVLQFNIINKSNDITPLLKNKKSKHHLLELHCYEPWLHLTIWPNGTVANCSFPGPHLRGKWQGSLKQTWDSKYFKDIRESVKNKKKFDYCSRCVTNVVLDTLKLKENLKKELENGR